MPRRAKLSINLNKIALLRNQRDVGYPDPLKAARSVIQAGADGVTVHPRPDQRHIRKSDVTAIAAMLAEDWARAAEFNIEGYPSPEFLELISVVRPTQTTLVPDAPDQHTSDHGWDLPAQAELLRPVVSRLKDEGIRVSLFLDPEPDLVRGAADLGADRVELYTEPYAKNFASDAAGTTLERYRRAAAAASDAGLGLNAGHDLALDNLPTLVAALPELAEVSIGHAFTADALWLGLEAAVGAYLDALTLRQ